MLPGEMLLPRTFDTSPTYFSLELRRASAVALTYIDHPRGAPFGARRLQRNLYSRLRGKNCLLLL